MTSREIYEVYAKIIDANGSYNTLSGYPIVVDSNTYDGDLEKTRNRAYGEWYDVLSKMCKRDDRKVQFAMIIQASTGLQIECKRIGELNEPEASQGEVSQE